MKNIITLMIAVLAAMSGAASAQTWDGAGGRPVMPDAAQLRSLPSPAPEAGFAAAVRQEAGQNDAELVNGLADLVAAEVKDFIKYRVTTAAAERKKLACLADPKTRKTPFVERTCDEHGCDAVGAEYIGIQCGKDQLTVTINAPGSKFKVITEVRKNSRQNYLVYLPRAPKDAVTHEALAKAGALVDGALFPEAFKRGIPVGVVKGLEALSSGEGPAAGGVIHVVDGTAKSADIRQGRPHFSVDTDPYIADQASEIIFNWLSADADANMTALQAWMAANGVQDGVVEFIYNKKHAEKRAEFARTLQG